MSKMISLRVGPGAGLDEAQMQKVQDAIERGEAAEVKADSALSQLASSAKNINGLHINIKDYTDQQDITSALNTIAAMIKGSTNCKIKLTKGVYKITDAVIFTNAQGLTIEGHGYETQLQLDLNDSTKYGFDFRPGNFSGSALNGLTLSNLNIKCLSPGNVIKTGSLNDHILFEKLHITNVYDKAFHLFTKHPDTPLVNEHIEGVRFDGVTIIGHVRASGEAEITTPLIVIDGNSDANEIIWFDTKFQINLQSQDVATSHPRPAIQFNVPAKGNVIENCRFVAARDCNVIEFNGSAIGNRIFSNLLEQITEQVSGTSSFVKFTGLVGEVNHNSISFNRFESPINVKYLYKFLTSSYNVVLEPFVKLSHLSLDSSSKYNSLFLLGNTRTSNNNNSLFSNNGRGFDVTSEITVASRSDVNSNRANDPPYYKVAYIDANGTVLANAFLGLDNTSADAATASKLGLYVNGVKAMTVNASGDITPTGNYRTSTGQSGATGSFTTADGKTVTVTKGLITAIT